mgnify:CR=1 FL=1
MDLWPSQISTRMNGWIMTIVVKTIVIFIDSGVLRNIKGKMLKKANSAVIEPAKKIYWKSSFPKIVITRLGFSLMILLSFGEKARAIAGIPSVTRLI